MDSLRFQWREPPKIFLLHKLEMKSGHGTWSWHKLILKSTWRKFMMVVIIEKTIASINLQGCLEMMTFTSIEGKHDTLLMIPRFQLKRDPFLWMIYQRIPLSKPIKWTHAISRKPSQDHPNPRDLALLFWFAFWIYSFS